MSKVKCEDCTFGFLKKLMGELGPCTRLDDGQRIELRFKFSIE